MANPLQKIVELAKKGDRRVLIGGAAIVGGGVGLYTYLHNKNNAGNSNNAQAALGAGGGLSSPGDGAGGGGGGGGSSSGDLGSLGLGLPNLALPELSTPSDLSSGIGGDLGNLTLPDLPSTNLMDGSLSLPNLGGTGPMSLPELAANVGDLFGGMNLPSLGDLGLPALPSIPQPVSYTGEDYGNLLGSLPTLPTSGALQNLRAAPVNPVIPSQGGGGEGGVGTKPPGQSPYYNPAGGVDVEQSNARNAGTYGLSAQQKLDQALSLQRSQERASATESAARAVINAVTNPQKQQQPYVAPSAVNPAAAVSVEQSNARGTINEQGISVNEFLRRAQLIFQQNVQQRAVEQQQAVAAQIRAQQQAAEAAQRAAHDRLVAYAQTLGNYVAPGAYNAAAARSVEQSGARNYVADQSVRSASGEQSNNRSGTTGGVRSRPM